MAKEFRLPDLGEGVHEGQIVRLLVDAGAPVTEDDPLMEVETDKASVEIPSPFTGIVAKWHVEVNQVVNTGDVMVTIDMEGSDAASSDASTTSSAAASTTTTTTTTTSAATTGHSGSGGVTTMSAAATVSRQPTARTNGARRKPASPAVRKRARVLGLDIETVPGTGPGGRVTLRDVEAAATAGVSTPSISPSTTTTGGVGARTMTPAAPPPMMQPVLGVEPPGTDDTDAWGPIRRHAVPQARKTIARNMAQSWSSIPHVTDCDDADVTELDLLRRGYPAPENGQRKVTMLAFVIRAVARALQMMPVFNAAYDDEKHEITYHRYINIAVGVHTERGIIAPVIRNADQLGVIQIADALGDLANKARSGSFSIEDTRGGTYTVSNAGAFGGSRYSTPIITPGQGAVLAIGRTRRMPWVVDDEITPRSIMPLSHSFDHRLADGALEIQFMRQIIDALEHPARMLL